MADDNIISNAIDFYQKIKDAKEVTIRFSKQDGSIRVMKCTLDFDRIPSNKKPKDVNMAKILNLIQKYGMIHVYDLDKGDWRTVPFEKSEWIETPQRRYMIKKS